MSEIVFCGCIVELLDILLTIILCMLIIQV